MNSLLQTWLPISRSKIILIVLLLLMSISSKGNSQDSGTNPETTDKLVIRFGIVTFYNPRLMILRYQPFIDALSERTPYQFELVLSTSYHETVSQLEKGEIDIAYLGPVTYVRARKRFGAIPLVRLNTGGSSTFRSVLCVREDSPINGISDLGGSSIAFGSPLSTSSHLYPRLMLKNAGIKLSDLESFTYYNRHDNAAKAVLTGNNDVCGIRDVVAARYEDKGLKIIARSDPIPNFPIVYAPGKPDSLISLLRETLLELNPSAKDDSTLMSRWDVELRGGFVPVSAADYDMVEQIMIEIFKEKAFEGEPEVPGADHHLYPGGGFFR